VITLFKDIISVHLCFVVSLYHIFFLLLLQATSALPAVVARRQMDT